MVVEQAERTPQELAFEYANLEIKTRAEEEKKSIERGYGNAGDYEIDKWRDAVEFAKTGNFEDLANLILVKALDGASARRLNGEQWHLIKLAASLIEN